MIRNIKEKSFRLLMIFSLVFIFCKKEGRFAGINLADNKSIVKNNEIRVSDVQCFFQNTHSLHKQNEYYAVLDKKNKVLGKVLYCKHHKNEVKGFGGPVPIMIALSCNDTVLGVNLLENNESPAFIERITKQGFFTTWNGYLAKNALLLNVDAISGASETTNAVVSNVNFLLSAYIKLKKNNSVKKHFAIKHLLYLLVILLYLWMFFFPAKFRKYRLVILILSIIIFGFVSGNMLSFAFIHSFIVNGIKIELHKIPLLLLLIASFVLPAITNKSFYCSYVCPFGACQELAGKIRKRKMHIPHKLSKFLETLRLKIFIIVIFLLIIDISIDLSLIEPFPAFFLSHVALFSIGFAVTILLLSVLINKPWCRYCCPTGQLMEIFRIKTKS